METERISDITRDELKRMSLKERVEKLEKVMEAAELLVEELGKMALTEDIELINRN